MTQALQNLRQQLQERFPEAHCQKPAPPPIQASSGLPAFPAGALSELSPAGPAAGLSLILAELLQRSEAGLPSEALAKEGGQKSDHEESPPTSDLRPLPATANPATAGEDGTTANEPLALIDGHDSFDPASYGPASCARLLWVRCHHAEESLHCTDLLLRDGNLPLLALDLQLNPLAELHEIPSSSWYRLRNLARQSGSTLLVFTPHHLVPCAALQLTFASTFSLTDLEELQNRIAWNEARPREQAAVGAS